MPALFKRISILPASRRAVSTHLLAVASSFASPATGYACVFIALISAANASSLFCRRAVITTLAPSAAKARADALPIPALAPVTIATLPLNFPGILTIVLNVFLIRKASYVTHNFHKSIVFVALTFGLLVENIILSIWF